MNREDDGRLSAASSFIGGAGALLNKALWAYRRTWSASRFLLTGVVGTALLRAFLPAGLVLIIRGLINAVASALKGGEQTLETILPWLALGLALSLAEALSRITYTYMTRRLHDELDLSVTAEILEHASDLEVAHFEDPGFQDVMERARQNTAGHFSQFINNTLETAAHLIQIATLVAILIFIEPVITLVLILLGIPYLFTHWRFARLRYETEHSRATKRRWSGYFVSQLLGQRSVAEARLLDLPPLFIGRFRSLMAGFRDQDRRLQMRVAGARALFVLVTTAAFYGAFAWVAYRALRGALTIGDVAIFGGITARLTASIEVLVTSVSNAMEEALYISNLMEFLKVEPGIVRGVGLIPSPGPGEVKVQDVHFTYPGSERPALEGVSLHIKPGETLALVGENGAGKTTLAKLIARLYDPDRGRIMFDGTDLRELSPDQLHRRISFVFQVYGRYEATVAENIAYGDWRRMMDDRERVEMIGRLAGVDDIVKTMSRGYDTLLGRMFGEFTLSDGQWQKIAVARALAREASLLILDEPTASLDARTEYDLFSRFREIAEGRTTILISHRFSTVSIADRIAVMDSGRIIEEGTHRELLDLSGQYAGLYELHRRRMDFSPSG